MASQQTGISGLAVALVSAGALLVYAGLRGVDPLTALRDVSKGKKTGISNTGIRQALDTSVGSTGSAVYDPSSGGGVVDASYTKGSSSVGNALAQAAMAHSGEKYSQARRWERGYSDCSSFVGKAFKDIGIAPPGSSVTGSYLTWTKLKTVPKSQIQTGDLLCGAGHIAIAISPTTAIGQQNSHSNVRTGSFDSIMSGGGTWYPRRYIGTRAVNV